MTFDQYFRLWLLIRHMREQRDLEDLKRRELREYATAQSVSE